MRFEGKKVIVASGYFDPLHIGHVDYLKLARMLGDMLVVIVNNDKASVGPYTDDGLNGIRLNTQVERIIYKSFINIHAQTINANALNGSGFGDFSGTVFFGFNYFFNDNPAFFRVVLTINIIDRKTGENEQ